MKMRLHFERSTLPVDELSLIDQLNQAFTDLTGPFPVSKVVCVERFLMAVCLAEKFCRNSGEIRLFHSWLNDFETCSNRQPYEVELGTSGTPLRSASCLASNPELTLLTSDFDRDPRRSSSIRMRTLPIPLKTQELGRAFGWVVGGFLFGANILFKWCLSGCLMISAVVALADLGAKGKLLIYALVLPWKDDQAAGWSEHHRVIEQQSVSGCLRKPYQTSPYCITGDYNSIYAKWTPLWHQENWKR